MLHIKIICVGKQKEKYLKDGTNEYLKRISKYCKIDIIEVQDEKLPDKINNSIINQIKEKECKRILENVKTKDFIFALDLKGKEYSSTEFAREIEKISVDGYGNICFIIGGTLGLTNEVLERANKKVCFSKMTFPHQLIRIFLLEQIFRSFKILNNETYHW